MLSLMIFVPLLGMLVVLFAIRREQEELAKRVTFIITLIPLLIAVFLFIDYDRSASGHQYEENMMWIEAFNIRYHVGIDGLSVTLVLLTALLGPICVLASWKIEKGNQGIPRPVSALGNGDDRFLLRLDMFLFYVFFELTLLPMYFLIGIWGGERREYAAIKFFLYTLFGSVLMLIAMIAVYLKGGTFDIPTLIELAKTPGPRTRRSHIPDMGVSRFLHRFCG